MVGIRIAQGRDSPSSASSKRKGTMKIKEIIERAALTFAESALVVIVASGTDLVNLAIRKGAALAGAAALLSFILNSVRSNLSSTQ